MGHYHEITCASACNHLSSKHLPYSWDLNAYRGCAHGCKYCYAIYSHQYLGAGVFFEDIFVKKNIVECLEQQLASRTWKGEVINLGGVTDNYQPAEANYQLMPEILRLLIHYQNPVILSTKSDLILRDFALIEELASLTSVNIAATITCVDEGIRRKLEPGAASSQRRFEVLRAFAQTKASTGVHLMPIIPHLTDDEENLSDIFAMGKDCGADYILPGALNLRGPTRGVFFNFLKSTFPDLYAPLQTLYREGRLDRQYQQELHRRTRELSRVYGLSLNYRKPMEDRLRHVEGAQLSLFDD